MYMPFGFRPIHLIYAVPSRHEAFSPVVLIYGIHILLKAIIVLALIANLNTFRFFSDGSLGQGW